MQLLRIRTSLFEEAAPVPADTIVFAVTSVSKVYGDAAFVNALTNTGDGTVTFSSSDTSVATVNSSTGQVTIVRAGNATITATVADGATSHYDVNTASYTLSVAKATRTVTFTNLITQVDIGGTVTNAATISAGASDGTLTYSSSNTSYATVSSSGVVTGVAAGSVTITATISGGTNYQDATGSYSMTVANVQPITVEDFDYTGSVQIITIPAGTYKLECWGAQGGNYGVVGGKGGYSTGTLTLSGTTVLYIYVGGAGKYKTSAGLSVGGFNGGGHAYATSGTYINGSGGGASDIRIGQDSLYARVIVAGGGGGFGRHSSSQGYYKGGCGGGYSGGDGAQYDDSSISGKGGTQIGAGDSYYGTNKNSASLGTLAGFGVGGGAISGNTSYRTVGGGGGWYGGGYSQRAGAGGGSGFVWVGDNAPSGYLLNSSHYLSSARTVSGEISMPSTSGETEIGHEGNGYVRITKTA